MKNKQLQEFLSQFPDDLDIKVKVRVDSQEYRTTPFMVGVQEIQPDLPPFYGLYEDDWEDDADAPEPIKFLQITTDKIYVNENPFK